MFGYIRMDKPELKIREYETYKAVYCSLCRALGRQYGLPARFTLNYDFTFLALLQLALQAENTCFARKCCVCNPLKKCNYCKDPHATDFSAGAAMILLYYKLADNCADERGGKRILAQIGKAFFARAHRKAAQKYPAVERLCADYIATQNAVEQDAAATLDAACDPTAKMLGGLLKMLGEDETQQRILERLGYCLGRYLYLMDAACDAEEDRKSGSFNVLKNEPDVQKRVIPQLYFCINEAVAAFELLEVKRYRNILGNILGSGLETTFKKEFEK